MHFNFDFSLLAVLLIAFTAFIAAVVNAATNLFSNKEKRHLLLHYKITKNWKTFSNE